MKRIALTSLCLITLLFSVQLDNASQSSANGNHSSVYYPAEGSAELDELCGDKGHAGYCYGPAPDSPYLMFSVDIKDSAGGDPVILDDKVAILGMSLLHFLELESGKVTKTYNFAGAATPAVSGEKLLMPCVWRLICFDMDSESVLWESHLEGGISSDPLVYCGRVFTAGGWCPWMEHADEKEAKKVICFDQFTGEVLWKYSTNGKVCHSPSISDSVLYVGSDDGCIYALDVDTGELIWKREIGTKVQDSLVIFEDCVIVASDLLYCLDKRNGNTVWKFQRACRNSPVVAYDLIFCTDEAGIYALNKEGNIVWENPLGCKITSSLVADQKLFLWSIMGTLYALNVFTGNEVWQYDTGLYNETHPDYSRGALAISEGILVLSTNQGKVIAFGIEPECLFPKGLECEEQGSYCLAYNLYSKALIECENTETKKNVEEKLSELIDEHGDEIAIVREFRESLVSAYTLIYQNEDEEALSLLEELRVEANELNLENAEEINCLVEYLGRRKSTIMIRIVVITAIILLTLLSLLKRMRKKTTIVVSVC
ncbi:MAG: PQQ-binding-like beta-propeller repeat protein [Theionarchaea archaeon]|nr:PQQ-binding-like beta-propeller repeat protein [Theionarchaea archaeon]MBU7037232.1 PQQ-binding-like beta-propeller repeat protein [Theionarchaea archaeon]